MTAQANTVWLAVVWFNAACLFLASAWAGPVHADGRVKDGVSLFVNKVDEVVFLDQGFSAAPGEVGGLATDLPYLAGWGWESGFIEWTDTNGADVLRMNHFGLDVLIHGGHTGNGSRNGNVHLTATTQVGVNLRATHGLGRSNFQEPLFKNGSLQFLVRGCVGIGEPDLVVPSVSVNDHSLDPGQEFTLLATVKNIGHGTCDWSTLRYRLSGNPQIDPADTQLAHEAVSGLGTNGTTDRSATVHAPNEPGVYWVGACMDSVVGEMHLPNCSDGIQINVGQCDTVSIDNQTVPAMETFQACRELSLGPSLEISTDLGASFYGGEVVRFDNGVQVLAGARLTVGTCDHDICTQNIKPLTPCMPCVEAICEADPSCCDDAWGSECVDRVETICLLPCAP